MKTARNRLMIWGVIIILLLLIPFIGMKLTAEINWDITDFLIMGSVLAAIALIYELVIRRSQKTVYKAGFIMAIIGAFLLFWVNGAVGIIGNEAQDANLLYGATFLTGIVGSIISKFKAKGMSNTLFATALVQLLIPVAAIVIWPPSSISWSPGVLGVFMLSSFFAILFFISGFLFKRAADKEKLIGQPA